jgi:NACalpha-BTF3-like transcription factor
LKRGTCFLFFLYFYSHQTFKAMKTKALSLLFLMVSTILIFACSSNEKPESSSDRDDYNVMADIAEEELTPVMSSPDSKIEESTPLKIVEQASQYIIKTADIKMMVDDVNISTEELEKIIKKHGGYISNSNLETKTYSFSNSMSVRIPAPKFDLVIKEITTLGTFIDHRTVNAQDVTKAYVDTEVRLKNKLEVEKRYIEILRSQAKTVRDILEVERQLNDIRIEIESAQSYLNSLKDKIQYSTLQLEIYQTVNYQKKPETNQKSFFTDLKEAFAAGWNGVLELILVFFHIWPMLIIGAIVAIAVIRIKKRKKM